MATFRDKGFWDHIESKNEEIKIIYDDFQTKISEIFKENIGLKEKNKKIQKESNNFIVSLLNIQNIDFKNNIDKYVTNQSNQVINYDKINNNDDSHEDVQNQIEKDKKTMEQFKNYWSFFKVAQDFGLNQRFSQWSIFAIFNKELETKIYEEFIEPVINNDEEKSDFYFWLYVDYFEKLEEEADNINLIFKRYNQELKVINLEYENNIKQNKIDDEEFKTKRNGAFQGFKQKYEELFPNLEYILTDNKDNLDYYMDYIAYNNNTLEQKKAFEKCKAIRTNIEEFEKRYKDYNDSNDNLQNITDVKQKYEDTVKKQKADLLRSLTKEGDFFSDETELVKQKIQILQEFRNESSNREVVTIVNNTIKSFKSKYKISIKILEKIKDLEKFKVLTTSENDDDNYKVKDDILLGFNFENKNDNVFAQHLLISEKSTSLSKEFVIETIKNGFKFDDIFASIETATKKSSIWRIWKTVTSKSKWFLKTLWPLNAIKSIINERKQLKNPFIFLDRDIEKLEKLSEKIAATLDNIKRKYARKMAKAQELNGNSKMDGHYIKKEKKEKENAKHNFLFEAKKICEPYENAVEKKFKKYSKDGRFFKKLKKLSKYLEHAKNNLETSFKDLPEFNKFLKNKTPEDRKTVKCPLLVEIIKGSNSLDIDAKAKILPETSILVLG